MVDFFNLLKNKYNIDLNNQQKQAVVHKEGPALVLAVPGAGKTTVLICRTANLIFNNNINPSNILSITFSKASAKDMENRFNNLFNTSFYGNVNFSTIHSFSYSILRDFAYLNKLKFTLIESINKEINKNIIISNIYKEINNSIINEDKLEELISSISYVKNMMLNDIDIKKEKFGIKNFYKIFKTYEDFKKKKNFIDFDDMLTMTYEILITFPNILEKYRRKYPYIQVDEGQDTSKIQYEIIKLLASPRNNLFIVADDDQSIYGFRGAYPQNLLEFSKTYNDSKTFFMEENFRSSNNIVSVCNDFIKSNKNRYDKNLFTNNPNKNPINIIKFKDEFGQLKFLIEKILELKNFNNTAILFRNNVSSIGIIEELIRNNIPFNMRDSKLQFFNHWVLKDINAFINISLNDSDLKSFERIYYKMNGYISKSQLQYISKLSSEKSVFDRLTEYPGLKTYQIDNILRIKYILKSLYKKNALDAINSILYELDYISYLKDNSERFGYSYDSIKVLISNIKIIAKNSNSLLNYIERINNLKEVIESSKYNRSNSIRLSTIHSSKGLEFENVFIVDLIDGEFPANKDFDDINYKKFIEEERRLFYVGMTRAKTNLFLITFKSRNNERVYQSIFLDELEKIVLNSAYDEFSIGRVVFHKKFGKGFIKEIDDDILTVQFNDFGIKNISLSLSLDRELIKAI